MKRYASPAGFTLVEMAVTVAVLAIILSVATPSFTNALDSTRLKSQAMHVIDVIEFAKSEATKSGVTRNSTAGTWNTTVTISVTGGSNWSVTAQSIDGQGNATQRKASHNDVSGVSIQSPNTATMTMNFRRIITGDIDTPIVLESAKGRQVQVSVSATGRVTTCAVGTALGGFPLCTN